jgi:transposase
MGGDERMNANIIHPQPAEPKANKPRPRYDAAFKQSAVEHCLRHGGNIKRSAQELGLNHWSLRDWLQAHRRKTQPPAPARSAAELAAENARLRTDLARITEQRDILKKSLGILSHL